MDERFQSGSELSRVEREEAVGDVSRPPEGRPPSSELASLALGAVFALAAFPAIHMIFVLWSSNFRGFGRLAEGAAAVVGFIGGLFVVGCAGVGFAFGIMGMTAARRQGRPIALGLAGLLLNFLDLWAWVGILVCWGIALAR